MCKQASVSRIPDLATRRNGTGLIGLFSYASLESAKVRGELAIGAECPSYPRIPVGSVHYLRAMNDEMHVE